MDFLRRIEDDVRNLGVESKRKHPEVREAAERALLTLRTMRGEMDGWIDRLID
jgi:hypothetical protein